MKSMLHEAQSIQKAIEQAWSSAGKPTEFTIKVLDAGEKGLLWFVKRPAIVSISYDPKKNPGKSAESTSSSQKPSFKKNNDRNRFSKADKVEKEERFQQRQLREATPSQPSAPRPTEPKNKRHSNAQQPSAPTSPKVAASTAHHDSQITAWTPEAVEYVSFSLREFVPILQLPSNFSTEVDNKLLRIVFDKKIMPSADEEKMLCIGLSYILMQFLKKNYKKKFKGFQIILTAKSSQHGDQTNNSSL